MAKNENFYSGLSKDAPGQLPPGSFWFNTDRGDYYPYPDGIKEKVRFHYADMEVTDELRYPTEIVREAPDQVIRQGYFDRINQRTNVFSYSNGTLDLGDIVYYDLFLGEYLGVDYFQPYYEKVAGVTSLGILQRPLGIVTEVFDGSYMVAGAVNLDPADLGITGLSTGPQYIGADGSLTNVAPIGAGNHVVKVGYYKSGTAVYADRLILDFMNATIISTDATKATHINGVPLA